MSKKNKYAYKNFSITIPLELYNIVKAVAKSQEHSVSSYIRKIIYNDINKHNIDIISLNDIDKDILDE